MRTRKVTPEPAPEFRDLLRRRVMTLSMLERAAGLGRNDAWRYAAGMRSPRLNTVARMSQAMGEDVGIVARSLMHARERWEQRGRVEAAILAALRNPSTQGATAALRG